MASTYSDLKIELIGTGEQTGTWGTTTNNNFSIAVGEAITGSADVAFSSADVTITLTNTNASQAARNLRLNLTGTSGGARNLILGSGCQIEKLYLINNGLADAVTVKNTTGTGIAVPAGKTMFVYNNGTNVVEAVNSAVTLDVTTLDTTNLEVTNIKAKDGTASATIANSTGVMTVASSVLTTTDINGGTIDGTTIGGSTAAAGNFTTLGATGVATFSAGSVSAPAITTTGDTNTGIFFPAADTIAFTEGGAESMRIDSSGNVGIGTSSALYSTANRGILNLNGSSTALFSLSYGSSTSTSAYLYYSGDLSITNATSGGTMNFLTQDLERMRIDSSGNLLVGTSAQLGGERGNFTQTSTGAVLRVINSNASFADTALAIGATGRTSSSAFNFINCGATNADQFRVRGDGVIFAQNTTVQSISDVRTKENIADAENGLAVINALRPVRFDFKDGFGNNKKNQLGFIAQEMEVVFPDAVDTWCESDDPEQPYKSVGTTALIPVLVKAIQELKAELDGVKAELQTLKGN